MSEDRMRTLEAQVDRLADVLVVVARRDSDLAADIVEGLTGTRPSFSAVRLSTQQRFKDVILGREQSL